MNIYRHLISLLILLFFPTYIWAQEHVKIRLFADYNLSTTTITIGKGPYTLATDNGNKFELKENDMLVVMLVNKKIVVKRGNDPSFTCDSLKMTTSSKESYFSIRANGTQTTKRTYNGDITCYHDLGGILITNILEVEDYIAGVVEAEGGTGNQTEYIKTQAIIARTYLYKYHDKHSLDGFDLCDGTHCQAFHGIASEEEIVAATNDTKGQIIVGSDNQPIQAAFHSNCGGETANSEDVWLAELPYLRSVKDPYCVKSSRNANWEVRIPLSEWKGYMQGKGYAGTNNNDFIFSQTKRVTNYKANTFIYPLSEIRNDFNLKSTLFSVSLADNEVVLKGKGYGHGVGLCQEGAIEMARQGHKYNDIINFYYYGVKIVNRPLDANK
ncbi:MAG: SpoIID/LytB domain-containing protein [Bacteroidales bacterium]|nr:SpoIID/LytB domain-containing protein [Bacteroidales bacterium]